MWRTNFFLGTILFVTVNAGVVNIEVTNTDEVNAEITEVSVVNIQNIDSTKLLKNLSDGFDEFDKLHEELLTKIQANNYTERRRLWDVVFTYFVPLNRNFKATNATLKSEYESPMYARCRYLVQRWFSSFRILKGEIRMCAHYQFDIASSHLNLMTTNATCTKRIMSEHLQEARNCQGETCGKLLQDHSNYSNSALATLKNDNATYYAIFDDTKRLTDCIDQKIEHGFFDVNTKYYLDNFKECIIRETNASKETKDCTCDGRQGV